MPELPEVETVRRDLATHLHQSRFIHIEHLDWPRLLENTTAEGLFTAIAGSTIVRVGRRAKWLLMFLNTGVCLAWHLRMSGSLFVTSDLQPSDPHRRLILSLNDDRYLVFRDVRKFGRLRVLNEDGLKALESAHGPEPLSPEFTADQLATILRPRSTGLKSVLLNQHCIAGLGNIYVDEALWHARLHPRTPACSLEADAIGRLHLAIQTVLRSAIERQGSTLRDYRTGTGQQGNNQHYFNVYGRQNKPCPRCQATVVRDVVAQRGTHLCPRCQVAPVTEKKRASVAGLKKDHPADARGGRRVPERGG